MHGLSLSEIIMTSGFFMADKVVVNGGIGVDGDGDFVEDPKLCRGSTTDVLGGLAL